MREVSPRRCGLVWCGSTDGVRQFVTGDRCPDHTPSSVAGVPEPDELLARHRARLAELAQAGDAA